MNYTVGRYVTENSVMKKNDSNKIKMLKMNNYVFEYDKENGMQLLYFEHEQFLKYSSCYTCYIYNDNLNALFFTFFRCYENYKNHNENFAPFISGFDGIENKLFLQTAFSMKLTIEEMMAEIEKLYDYYLERKPELFI